MMPDDQPRNDTPTTPSSRYSAHEEPPPDKNRERYIESVHDALVVQANNLVDEVGKEGGETNKVRDVSLSVIGLSLALMVEFREGG
jgi:hypothetical protein